MVDKEDDDLFMEEFLARAKRRQAKLDGQAEAMNAHEEVSYPPLSPLPEEETITSPDLNDQLDQSSRVDKEENVSPQESELNYSSDLSLDCDINEVYRAEPVLCQSSPEQQQAIVKQQYRVAPRKQPSVHPQSPHKEAVVPLREQQPEHKATSSQSLPETSSKEQSLKEIQLKVDRAEQTRLQLMKAVEASKYGSKEHIEAARLLQIAEIEHLCFTNHMAMFKQGLRKKTESLGSVRISNMRLKVSPKLRNELAEDSVSHYFFCVASCGPEVRATNIIDTNDIKRQDLKAYIMFQDKIMFADLPPDFIVKVEVYELVIGQHLPKLLYRLTPSKKSKVTPEANFRRVGSLKLTLADRDLTHKNLVQWGKHEESKYLERECKFQIELKPEQLPCKAGMLHVRCLDNKGRPDWSRFYVDSSGGQVRFWKSRQDALDDKKPNQSLIFTDLCAERVQKLTPDDDLYRQNSFVLYSYQQVAGGEQDTLFQRVLKDDQKFKIVKHQLAAENKDDRDNWCTTLDRSMHCFREWHGKIRIYTLEELKEIFSVST